VNFSNSHTTVPAAVKLAAETPAPSCSLTVILRVESKGQTLTREPVMIADLAEARAEAWRECFLRKGWTRVPMAEADLRLVPIFTENSASLCTGFVFEGALPDGTTVRHEFSTRCLTDVAHRAGDRLVDLNILQAGQKFVYEVEAVHAPPTSALLHGADAGFEITVKTQPLRVLSVPLRPLLQQARAENLLDDSVHPVFFTEEALHAAERYSRKGSRTNPPVETGAALAGVLCSSPCGEFFSVVTEALEAVDAEKTQFSLTFSSRSWSRIQTVIRARQAAQPAFRMLGQCHGHNFLPNEGQTCEACPTRPTCDLTNLFVSSDDRTWSRAVFSQQPWGLCLIHGLSARSDRLHGLWGMQDGRLRERGYFVLPEFDPEHWELKP